MEHPTRVCLIDAPEAISLAFQEIGCDVRPLSGSGRGLLHLPGELAALGFEPELVLQCEHLGARLLLTGLEDVPGVRCFWAVDPHLNAFWQAAYARLFDRTFSTQGRWLPHLAACGAQGLLRLPWYAPDESFVPHAGRQRLAGFVGRLGPTRPVRTWLVELLRGLLPAGGFELRDGLDLPGMLAFYRDTRLVPNESITAEVNFRLFEAAGCGCVVLAQDLGPEQAEYFEPGREMLVCGEALELAENLRLLAARPRLAEAMGRAAWERARACHLPAARCRSILAEAGQTSRRRLGAAEAEVWLLLALAGLEEAGRPPKGTGAVLPRLAALAGQEAENPVPDATALLVLDARLRLARASGAPTAGPLAQAEAWLRRVPSPCSGAALRLALAGAALHLGLGGAPDPQDEGLAAALRFARLAGVDCADEDPVGQLTAWARRLEAAGTPSRGGFGFDVLRHLPATALECLHCARALAPQDVDVLRATLAAADGEGPADAQRLGLLSELTLRTREDWRAGLALGLGDLSAFRPGPGLEELALAWRLAEAQGQDAAFAAALRLADASGRVRRALGLPV